MSVGYRPMREGQEDAVATMIRQLPKDLGLDVTATITGDILRKWRDEVHVTIADDSGLLVGVCMWFITYSTWRGLRGMHVSDLYVMSHMRGRNIGAHLLRAAGKDAAARGAQFIKLEVSLENPRPPKFYKGLGFELHESECLMFLEPDQLKSFLNGSK